MPDAVAGLLRAWSVPARRPVDIIWECGTPPFPVEVLPYGGWLPEHRGNDPDHHRGIHHETHKLWHDHLDEHRARFASYMRQVQRGWPDRTTVADFLERRTAELNASEPPAPDLDQLLEPTYRHHHEIGPNSSELIGLGATATCGWIDPAAVANVGYRRWNNFGGHRPDAVSALLTALLDISVEEALGVWSLAEEPICVQRIPGPTGPLYTLGENGAHRLTTARLASLPGIWATVDQPALPLQVHPHQTGIHGDDAARQLLTCWRCLLARDLVAGHIDEDSRWPSLSTLHLDDAAAIWLLATPKQAIAWAATYNRVYPGALEALDITPEAYADERAWATWLAAAP
ncbi:hypothetical protein [Nonomuraea sp. NPDC049400]|uniref:hypothetical protein n=1 Tax=Nonomuraea sp. NPDC049400 TaxID=3364352 RepID=UPI0037A60CF5